MPPTAVEIATRLAHALDVEDYIVARAILDDDCIYTGGPDGDLTGPDAIIASYRSHGAVANPRFDEVIFGSEVIAAGEAGATIKYLDRLRLGEQWHDHRCVQHVRVGLNGLVVEIRHENLPGETESLRAFEAGFGPRGD